MVARGDDLMIPVKHSVEDGERQPAHGERYHDGQQHDVDSFGFTGPVLIVSHLVHHVVSPFQAYIYLQRGGKKSSNRTTNLIRDSVERRLKWKW